MHESTINKSQRDSIRKHNIPEPESELFFLVKASRCQSTADAHLLIEVKAANIHRKLILEGLHSWSDMRYSQIDRRQAAPRHCEKSLALPPDSLP